jgi:hypothetical protein
VAADGSSTVLRGELANDSVVNVLCDGATVRAVMKTFKVQKLTSVYFYKEVEIEAETEAEAIRKAKDDSSRPEQKQKYKWVETTDDADVEFSIVK